MVENSNTYSIYEDIKERTNGDIYIGIVGPVRTGKSSFIKRFMDLCVIPNILDDNIKQRAIDELPQSGSGKTIMTTEPKFIPKDNANVELVPNCSANVRLIDCVGYMVEGAFGNIEDNRERLVKTPWSEHEIPFSKAAEIGTTKVIEEHSTIGIVITTDSSFSDIPEENYRKSEKKAIIKLKQIGKPFIIVLNSSSPHSKATHELACRLSEEYKVSVIPLNVLQLKRDDITVIFRNLLMEFNISSLEFKLPSWIKLLDNSNPLKEDIIRFTSNLLEDVEHIKDVVEFDINDINIDYIENVTLSNVNLSTGEIILSICLNKACYYQTISDMTGISIKDEYELIDSLKELAHYYLQAKTISDSLEAVSQNGYSVITPDISSITISEPVLIKNGSKYGIKINAISPSIHLINANIETEIAPIVGTKEQAQDLIEYISQSSVSNPDEYWNVNIFGKTIKQLVLDGINTKINKMNNETKEKLTQTLQKIVNESNGGVICIII